MQSAFFGHSKQKDYIYFVQLCQQQNTVLCWVILCANCKLFERPDKRFEYIAAFLKIPEEIKAGACRRKQNRIAWDRILIRTFYRIRVIFKMVNFYHILLRRVRSTNGRRPIRRRPNGGADDGWRRFFCSAARLTPCPSGADGCPIRSGKRTSLSGEKTPPA